VGDYVEVAVKEREGGCLIGTDTWEEKTYVRVEINDISGTPLDLEFKGKVYLRKYYVKFDAQGIKIFEESTNGVEFEPLAQRVYRAP